MPQESLAEVEKGARGELVKGIAEEGKRTVLKLIKTATVQAKAIVAQARGQPQVAVAAAGSGSATVEDMSFADLEQYLLGQAPLVTALYNEAAGVAVRAREQAQLLLDFGSALRALGQSETGAGAGAGAAAPAAAGGVGSLSSSLMSVGLASWAASTAAYEQAVCETELFVEKLADYVRLTRAVKECLDSRARASADLSEATSELERLRAVGVALANGPMTPTSGKDKAQNEIDLQIAQKAAADARAFYDKAAASVLSETERLRANMRLDFRAMLLDFVSIQVRTELKLSQAWERIREETARVATAEGGAQYAVDGARAAAAGGIAY